MANQTHSMTVLKAAIHEVADRGRKVIDKRTKLVGSSCVGVGSLWQTSAGWES
jgi:hypothetical protein